MSTSNRRRATRHMTCVPAGVETPQKERLGLIRDASSTGALVFSKSKFNIDDPVKLKIRVDAGEHATVEVSGRVLRVERQTDGFWTFRIGVKFEPPREDLSSLFKSLGERQERLFGSGPS